MLPSNSLDDTSRQNFLLYAGIKKKIRIKFEKVRPKDLQGFLILADRINEIQIIDPDFGSSSR